MRKNNREVIVCHAVLHRLSDGDQAVCFINYTTILANHIITNT